MANHDANSETKFSYDVFLSFRGEDTRHTFTGNLYDALCRKGIITFMDDEKLRVEEQIAPALLKAIEESRISIIVFSENYAASTWCLDELVKILECQKEKNQIVVPIFYKLEPSDVWHQKNSYGHAMTLHETRFGNDSERVGKWRSALRDVSNLKGYHLKEGYEFKFIQEIVSKASIIVSPKDLDINEHIVGLEYRVELLKSLLAIESSNTTCMLGIYGTGGIGKTTLAKALYNSISNQFEGACFLFNVRETSNQYEGQKLLLQTLLSEMLEEGKIQLASVNEGTKTIKRRLGRKRVLIVLDDVDDIKQLEILAGERDWFGSGSRIIITTRDIHLLRAHEVKKIYEMNLLNYHESFELFCQNAFKRSRPARTYEDLSNRAIRYAKGLPLALKVIGSHLFGKNLGEWKSALDKYEESPHKNIQSILRISYDSLDCNERDIFLDIACFFKGQRLEYVKTILDGCDFYPEDGIRILVDKSLITVEHSCLKMHDLIQDMGREIVKQEAPKEAGERSRLWFHEHVLEVLTENTGSSKIEGIMLDPPQREEINLIDTAFEKMKKLRILIVRNTSFSSGPSYLPNQLRLLDWKNYPSQSFPPGFCPKKIVAFNLRGSPLVLENFPFQTFKHLTYMNVSYCYSVTQIPNVSGAKSLRELRLDRCEKLVTVDESVGFLPNLVYLSASECTQLQSFLPRICLPSLEYLSFNLCRSLEHFPEVLEKMDKPLKIYLIDTSIKELPHSICNLIGLDYVEMTGCKGLQHLPNSLFMLPNLVTLKVGGCSRLPESFKRLEGSHSGAECRPNLGTLHFGNAGLSDEDLHVIIRSFPNLKDLNVSSNDFVSLPASINNSAYLTSLDVSYCAKLEEIPELPSSVQKVDARHCNSLTAETSSMLWSQVRKEINRLEVMMPKTEIPEWFDHRSEGGFPVFRARRKFPIVALAFVFEEVNAKAKGPLPVHWRAVGLHLFIEGEHVHRRQYHNFTIAEDHVLLCDLQVLFSDEEWEGLDARVGHDNDWKTVHVECETDLTLSSWGVYMYRQETSDEERVRNMLEGFNMNIVEEFMYRLTNMDDIQFTSPYPSSSLVQSLETSDEEKVRNKLEGLIMTAIFEGFLMETRDLEERGYFNDMSPSFLESNQTVLEFLEKMSRRAMAQRDGRGSGFNLEDEEDTEGDSMLQWLPRIINFRQMVMQLTGVTCYLLPFISHCSLFPFGYEFAKQELVTLWVAEGLFQLDTRQEDDHEGDKVFDSLVSSEIIVPSRFDQSVDFFHHKTRKLLYKVNQSKITSSALEYVRILQGNMDNIVPDEKVLHLSIDSKSIGHMGFESLKRFVRLRTLFLIPAPGFFVEQVPRDLFLSLKHLRSLNFSRSLISQLPSSIGNLKSLRYIDLSYTPIKHLPDSIITLHKLQTLKLRGCLDLVGLPKGISKLTSLRHLDLDIIRQLKSMPPGMGNLTNLQTLSAFLVGKDDGCRIGELKNTINLTGAFCISRIENVSSYEEAEEADLINKNFLSKLELRWTDTRVVDAAKEEQILQHLRPPLSIKELTILYYGGFKLPSWISDSSYGHLVDITIYNCRNCECLPSIGQLPSLQFLHIIEMNELQTIDDQFCRDGKGQQGHAFPCLKELTIEVMPALEEWMGVQNGDFPCLNKFKVEHCPKLISLPLLSHLYSLRHLEMSYCANISSLPDGGVATSLQFLIIKDCSELKKNCHKGEGKDWGKIAHVPNIFIDDEEISCQ